MKSTIILLFGLAATTASAQVSIGKASSSSPSVSLEFYDKKDKEKAIILPWVTSKDNVLGSVDGTLIYDTSDKIVKIKKGGAWFNLSSDTTGQVATTLQNTKTENTEAKVQIGGNPTTDTTPGILVLADTNKAMVLPKIASPHLKIIKPEPGTMAYDTVAKQLAIYNGTEWSFWKP